MVTNLPAEARAKWLKVMEARSIEEKIEALEEFLSSVPKHKGTENLREWATKRLAELREEAEFRKKKKVGRGASFFIEKSGDVQVAVIGPPNVGKSSIVAALTGARTKIADYPGSTTEPIPGMLKHKDILIQLIDTPPIISSSTSSVNSRVLGLIRNADALVLVVDVLEDSVNSILKLKEYLESRGILITKPKGRVIIERERSGRSGVRFALMGKLIDCTMDDVRKLLESYRINNALVKVYGEVTLDDVENGLFENRSYKPTVVVINKADVRPEYAVEKAKEVSNLLTSVPVIVASAINKQGIDRLGEELVKVLELIRVYTKQPGMEISKKPLVLMKGSTVRDVAVKVHSKLLEGFMYAKIWGPSAKYPGERVGLSHTLMDGDIVEIHSRS
ncbi:MAG: GTPase [Desulfurococcaceae archaeon]